MDYLDLSALWDAARSEFLKWLLVRKGAAKRSQLRTNTRAAYRSALRQFFRGSDELLRLGYIPPRPWECSSSDAKAYKQALLYAGKAESTINQRLAACKMFYRYVRDTYRLPKSGQFADLISLGLLWPDPEDDRRLSLWDTHRANPFDSGKVDRLPVEPFGRAKFFTRAEFNAILDQIDLSTLNGLRDYALLFFLVTSCRRISEALNLTWGDIRQDDGQITYRYTAKGRVEQTDVIGPECWRAITTYLRAAGRLDTIEPAHHIFLGHVGSVEQRYRCDPTRPMSYSAASRLLKIYGVTAGVDLATLHPHAIRHRGLHNRVADMRRAGRSPDLIALRDKAGHKNIGTTQIYIQSTDETVTDDGLDQAEGAHRRDLPEI